MSLAPDYSNLQKPGIEEIKVTEIVTIAPVDQKSSVGPIVEEKCKDPCHDPCRDPCKTGWGWESFGIFVLSLIVLIVLFWIVFFSLKPPFVLQSDSNQVDTSKVLLAAVISAFILVLLIWLIKAAFSE